MKANAQQARRSAVVLEVLLDELRSRTEALAPTAGWQPKPAAAAAAVDALAGALVLVAEAEAHLTGVPHRSG
jgi:hypothetical protein